jgi:hypothetical protein
MCITVGNVGSFPYLTHASCFSYVVVMLLARGCISLPSPRVEAPGASAHGWLVGQGSGVREGGSACWW